MESPAGDTDNTEGMRHSGETATTDVVGPESEDISHPEMADRDRCIQQRTRKLGDGADADSTHAEKIRTREQQNGGVDPSSNRKGWNDRSRETWGNKIEFLLSVIGFAVDLGNVWRFPYICFRNGGGAFLIPYGVMLIFLGLPLFYMELALGQYHRCGAISIWKKICPLFPGIGYGICFIATFVGMYYNTIIAWAVLYMFMSFASEVPWASCNNTWNSPNCVVLSPGMNSSILTNTTVSAAKEYFLNSVLEIQKSRGIDYVGTVKWELALCLMVVFIIVYFSLWKGIKSSGKAVWFTATFPYVMLFIFLIRGCTLPGAKNGIIYYLKPQWDNLLNVDVWVDAAAQIFFSLGPGFGTLLALSSYNKFDNNCYKDALVTAVINCLTSFLAGFVVFSVLGYMAGIQDKSISAVAVDGPGLVFVVYPEAVSTIFGSVFWAISFFLMLITLGLDSSFGGLESVITAITDHFPKARRYREVTVAVLVLYCFLGSLPTTTYGGQYVVTLLDKHAAPISLLFICLMEVIAVNWFYGVRRFSKDINQMLGFEPGLFWKVCWSCICPIFLLTLFVLSIWRYTGIKLEKYHFPDWSLLVGWLITGLSIVCVPAYMIYAIALTKGKDWTALLKPVIPDSPHWPQNQTSRWTTNKPAEASDTTIDTYI